MTWWQEAFSQSGGLLYVRGKKESVCMCYICALWGSLYVSVFFLTACTYVVSSIGRFRFLSSREAADSASGRMIHNANVAIYNLCKLLNVGVAEHLTYRNSTSHGFQMITAQCWPACVHSHFDILAAPWRTVCPQWLVANRGVLVV